MELDFSKLKHDHYGKIEYPHLLLKTPHEETVGTLAMNFNLKFKLKYADTSEMSFDYPAHNNGKKVPFYDQIEVLSVIEAAPFGQYIVTKVGEEGDGIRRTKKCVCKSLETEFDNKKIVFEQGTYRLYSPLMPQDSILGIVLERMPGWTVGTIPAELLTRYRTFDDTSEYVLNWLRDEAAAAYDCIFVFDTISKRINVRATNDKTTMVPVFISFNNLAKYVEVLSDANGLFTSADVSGADDITIRDVNPTGTNTIYNLDYYIGHGDIPADLAQRWRDWENVVATKQPYFTSVVALKNSANAKYLTERARLTDLNWELASIENRRSTTLEALANAETAADKTYFEQRLGEIAKEIKSKKTEISVQKNSVDTIQKEYNEFLKTISDIVSETKKENFFTADEMVILERYLIDGNISDPTYAVLETDIGNENDSFSNLDKYSIQFDGISLTDVQTDTSTNRKLFDITGGTISISGEGHKLNTDGSTSKTQYHLKSDINRATFDYKDGNVVFSTFLGEGIANDVYFPSGNLTLVCSASIDIGEVLSSMIQDTEEPTKYVGAFSFGGDEGAVFFTRNVTEYQRYSVAQELYDYAVEQLKNASSPTYEFDVDSGNFLWAQKFEPFKNAVRLGCGIYLQLFDNVVIHPKLLEIDINFDDPSDFKLSFANTFKRKHGVWEPIGEVIRSASTISRNLNKNKLGYGSFTNTNAKDALAKFLRDGIDFTTQTVKSSDEQGVKFDKTGITVESQSSNYYLRFTNGMIALMDKETEMAKVGIGHFVNELTGLSWNGINAEVIAGIITLTEHLEVHCPSPNGEMMYFKATSKGVEVNNGSFVVQHDRNGMIALDTKIGFAVGDNDMYAMGSDGQRVFLEDHATAHIDMNGKLHLRDIDASGAIHGSVITGSEIYVGGNNTAQNCVFGVDANGKILGLETGNGKFRIDADGKSYFDNDMSISGNLSLTGSVTLGGTINWGENIPNKQRFAASKTGPWHDTMQDGDIYCCDWNYATNAWGAPYPKVGQDGAPGSAASVPKYITSTGITATNIYSPTIFANDYFIYPYDNNDKSGSFTIVNTIGGVQKPVFTISYIGEGRTQGPYVDLLTMQGSDLFISAGGVNSENDGTLYIGKDWSSHFYGTPTSHTTKFYGSVDFSQADVSGVPVRFG